MRVHDVQAQWWTRLLTVLAGILRRIQRDNGHLQLAGYRKACHTLLREVPEQAHRVLRPNRDPPWQCWHDLLASGAEAPAVVIESWGRCAGRVAGRTQRQAIANAIRVFQKCVEAPTANGILHRSLKPRTLPGVEHVTPQRTAFHPRDIMDEKVLPFKALWAPVQPDLDAIRDLFWQIQSIAMDNPLPDTSPDMIDASCAKMKASPGL
eukprot:2900431-Pyramimonas_sp.AAC.1